MGYWFSLNNLFFLGNIGVWECLRPEWPQGSDVCSSLRFESALGYALGKSLGVVLLFVYLPTAAA